MPDFTQDDFEPPLRRHKLVRAMRLALRANSASLGDYRFMRRHYHDYWLRLDPIVRFVWLREQLQALAFARCDDGMHPWP